MLKSHLIPLPQIIIFLKKKINRTLHIPSFIKKNYQKMQNFEYEIININIFKYVDYPLNLALTCRNWSVIAKEPYAKSEWVIVVQYGKLHVLFHTVRLGPTFIDVPLCQTLIARN